METQPAELLKKIQELEAGQAQLNQEMSRLRLSDSLSFQHARRRSHSMSPERTRFAASTRRRSGGAGLEARSAWQQGSESFRHSSPLQREGHCPYPTNDVGGDGGCQAATNFADKQSLNILQSLGQSVHIFDLNGRIIYWCVMACCLPFSES